jgi:methyl-accepting chemotaxis protein
MDESKKLEEYLKTLSEVDSGMHQMLDLITDLPQVSEIKKAIDDISSQVTEVISSPRFEELGTKLKTSAKDIISKINEIQDKVAAIETVHYDATSQIDRFRDFITRYEEKTKSLSDATEKLSKISVELKRSRQISEESVKALADNALLLSNSKKMDKLIEIQKENNKLLKELLEKNKESKQS